MLRQAQDWTDKAQKLLSQGARSRKDPPPTIRVLRQLNNEAQNIPFVLEGSAEIQRCIMAVDDLTARIQRAFPRRNWRKAKQPLSKLNGFLEETNSLHVDFVEANTLRRHVEAAEKWASKAATAIADRAELKVCVSDASFACLADPASFEGAPSIVVGVRNDPCGDAVADFRFRGGGEEGLRMGPARAACRAKTKQD
jgi:hypothetical protein